MNMGVYIKGMEMPKEGSWKTVRIYPDGTCAVPNWQGDCTLIKGAQAVPSPPHGRWLSCATTDLMCSNCLHYWIPKGDQYDYHYCPNCGARMEGTE